MKRSNKIYLALFLLVLLACKGKENPVDKAEISGHLINANRIITHKEAEEIDKYIAIKNWNMIKTGTGLRYAIEGLRKGDLIKENQKVSITGELRDMNLL